MTLHIYPDANHHSCKQTQKKFEKYVDGLFERYSKLLLLRVDFAYRKNSSDFLHQDIPGLCADMMRFEYQLENISGVSGYIWIAEQGDRHGHHVHAAVFVNAQKRNKSWPVYQEISAAWEDVTNDNGYAHYCKPEPHHTAQAGKVIHFSDASGISDMKIITSYLAKSRQKPDGIIFSIRDLPEVHSSGRKRIYPGSY
ncbi:hypothetical protein [Buttiauxella gaviniae]|uniref:hypothetical protein n=1 Tax=Buttiauxella gaviniae TaxID=82990 RepID=UPI0039AFE4FF